MTKLISMFILALVPFFFNGSYNVIIDLLNYLIKALGPAVIHVVGMFPANPCGSLIASCSDVSLPADPTLLYKCLAALCWLVPMSFIVQLIGCAMLSVMIFFTMAPLARWLKLLN